MPASFLYQRQVLPLVDHNHSLVMLIAHTQFSSFYHGGHFCRVNDHGEEFIISILIHSVESSDLNYTMLRPIYIYMYTRWDALGCFNNMFHSKCRFEPSSKYLVCCEIMFTFVRISWQYNFCHIMWWARWKCRSPSKTHYLLFFTYSEWIGKYITEWREFQPAGQWWATVNFRCYRGVYSPQKF